MRGVRLWGYYSVQVQLVDLVILSWKALSSVHYMFRPNWPSSGVYYVRLLLFLQCGFHCVGLRQGM
jgi:hypothetical protein